MNKPCLARRSVRRRGRCDLPCRSFCFHFGGGLSWFCCLSPAREIRPESGGRAGGPCRGYRVVEVGSELVGRYSALWFIPHSGRPQGEIFVELAWAGVSLGVEEVGDFLAGFVAPDVCLPQWRVVADRGVGVQVAGVPAPFGGDQSAGVQLELEGVERFPAWQAQHLGGMAGEFVLRAEEHALIVS